MPKTKKIDERNASLRVATWFFSFPNKEMSLNDLAENVEISKTTAKKIVNFFVEKGFLKKEILGKTWRLTCNQQHSDNVRIKIPFNLLTIYESNILDKIHEIVPNSRAIILFGSYRKGDDTEESDVDIAVEVLDNKEVKIVDLGKIDINYRKKVQVNLHVFSRNKIDLNLFSNIANGIILEGFLEVRP